ncbi:MAG: M56 family metallopeptidase [Planctomycetota bacterium]
MDTFQHFFDWMMAATVRASVLVIVVLILQRLLQSSLSAKAKYLLWLPVLVALLFPAQPLLPHWMDWSLLMQNEDGVGTEIQNPTAVFDTENILSDLANSNSTINAREIYADGSHTHINDATPTLDPNYSQSFHWRSTLFAVWIAGAVCILAALLAGYVVTLRRIRKHAIPLSESGAMIARVDTLAKQIGLRSRPRIRLSSAVKSPSVCGLGVPHLLLNEAIFDELNDEETEFVLRHELMHLQRGDVPVNSLLCLLLSVHWFNPVLWYAFFRVRADREAACDADVLREETPERRVTYGKTLLKLESCLPESRLCLGFVGMFQAKKQLRHRIESIVHPVKMRLRTKTLLIVGVVLATLLGISKAAEPQQDPASTLDVASLNNQQAWQSDLTEFFDHLQSIARNSRRPDLEYLSDGILRGTDSWSIPVTHRYAERNEVIEFLGYTDLKPEKGTIQQRANEALKDREVQWDFEVARMDRLKVDEGSSNRQGARYFLELVPRYDDRGDQFSLKIPITRLSSIRVELKGETVPPELELGDRLQVSGTIGDFASNQGVMLSRFTGPIVAYKRGNEANFLQSTISIGLQNATIIKSSAKNSSSTEDDPTDTRAFEEEATTDSNPMAFRLRANEEGTVNSASYHSARSVSWMIEKGKAKAQDFVSTSNLNQHKQLTHLDFTYGSHLTADNMKSLSSLRNITEIEMGFPSIDSEYVTIEGGTQPLGMMKRLQVVRLCKDGINDRDLRFIASLSQLHTLELNADNGFEGGPLCTDECARSICQAKRLRHISIYDGDFTDEFVSRLVRELPGLKTLTLNSDRFTDEALRVIAMHGKNLEQLSISSKKFTKEGIQSLESLKKLTTVSVR